MATYSGLWTVCVFRVMTFNRPEMTFKAPEYWLIMNVDYFVPISFNMIYYTTLYLETCVFRVMTFQTPEMTFRASEKNYAIFYFVQ